MREAGIINSEAGFLFFVPCVKITCGIFPNVGLTIAESEPWIWETEVNPSHESRLTPMLLVMGSGLGHEARECSYPLS